MFRCLIAAGLLSCLLTLPSLAADWSAFRGADGSGVAADAKLPVTWSESENVKWKVPLPGPGSSSPIVVGDRVFVACYSGYGESKQEPGDIANLKRHLVCASLAGGQTIWEKTIEVQVAEDPYEGFITEHGYASNTPVSDGEHVYAFFGKSGVFAYDLDGNQLWQKSVGTSSGPQKWGSGASPILYDNLLIVNASEESESLVALDKSDGSVVWDIKGEGMASNWSTPLLVESGQDTELVIGVASEVWGLDPGTGEKRWFAGTTAGQAKVSSLVTDGDVVFSMGGRETKTVAVQIGGEGDVTESNLVWTSKNRGGIGSPVVYDGHLYWFTRGIARCATVDTGEVLYEERYKERGQQRGPGGADYCSPIAADGKIYFLTRNGTTYVIQAGPEYELLATNSFESDGSEFNGTPAIVDDQLLIRSNRFLYCVGE